jgi:hypothetical protein
MSWNLVQPITMKFSILKDWRLPGYASTFFWYLVPYCLTNKMLQLERFTKRRNSSRCNSRRAGICANQTNSNLTKFIVNSINIYVSNTTKIYLMINLKCELHPFVGGNTALVWWIQSHASKSIYIRTTKPTVNSITERNNNNKKLVTHDRWYHESNGIHYLG